MTVSAPGLSENVDTNSGNLRVAVDVASVPGLTVQARYAPGATSYSWNPSFPNAAGLGTFWNPNWFGRFRWDVRHRAFGHRQQDNYTRAGNHFNGESAGFELPDGTFHRAYREPPGSVDGTAQNPPFDRARSVDWNEWQRHEINELFTADNARGRLTDGSRFRIVRSETIRIPGPSVDMEFVLPEEIEVTTQEGQILRFAHRVGAPETGVNPDDPEYPHEFSPQVADQTLPVQFTALYLTEIESPNGVVVRIHYYGGNCDLDSHTPIPRLVETGRGAGGSFERNAAIVFDLQGGASGTPTDRCDIGAQSRLASVRYPGPNDNPAEPSASWRTTRFGYCETTGDSCAAARGEEGPDLVSIHTGPLSYRFNYSEVELYRPRERTGGFWIPIPIPLPGNQGGLHFITVGQRSRRIDTVTFRQPRITSIELPGGDRLSYRWSSSLHLIDGAWRDRSPWVDIGIPGVPTLGGELDSGYAAYVDGVDQRTFTPRNGPVQQWDLHHGFFRRGAHAYSLAVVEYPDDGGGNRPSSLHLYEPMQITNGVPEAVINRPASARIGLLLESRHYSDSVWCPVDGDERGELCRNAFTRSTMMRREQVGYTVHFAGLDAKPDRMNRWSPVAQCINGQSQQDFNLCKDRQYHPVWIARPSYRVLSMADGESGPVDSGQCCYRSLRDPVLGNGTSRLSYCRADRNASRSPSCSEHENETSESCRNGVSQYRSCYSVTVDSQTIYCGAEDDYGDIDEDYCGYTAIEIEADECEALPSCSAAPPPSGMISLVTEHRVDAPSNFDLAEVTHELRNDWDRDLHAAYTRTWTTDRDIEISRAANITDFPRCQYNELHSLGGDRWTNTWGCAYRDSAEYRQDRLAGDGLTQREPGQIQVTHYLHEDLTRPGGDASRAGSYVGAGMTGLVRSIETWDGFNPIGTPDERVVFGYDNESRVDLGGVSTSAAYPDSPVSVAQSNHQANQTERVLGQVTAMFEVDPSNPARHRGVYQLYASSNTTAPPGILLEQSFIVNEAGQRRRIRYGYEDWRSQNWSAQYAIGGSEAILIATRDVDPLGYTHTATDGNGTSWHTCYDEFGRVRAGIRGEDFAGCSDAAIANAEAEIRYAPPTGTSPARITTVARGDGIESVSHTFVDGLGRTVGTQAMYGTQAWGSYTTYRGTQALVAEQTVARAISNAGSDGGSFVFPSDFGAISRTQFQYDGLGRRRRITVFDGSSSTPLHTTSTRFLVVERNEGSLQRHRFAQEIVSQGAAGGSYTRTIVFDGRLRPSEILLPGRDADESLRYEYDARGHVLRVRHPDGAVTHTREVDSFGRVTRIERPDEGITRFVYDYTDTPIRIDRGFDPNTGTALSSIVRELDAFGRVQRVQDGSGTLLQEYFYDSLPAAPAQPSLLAVRTSESGAPEVDPHLSTRIARIVGHVDGITMDFGYDQRGHLSEFAVDYPEIGVKRSYFDYNRLGQRVGSRYQPGQADGISFEYDHDSTGRLIEVRDSDPECAELGLQCGDINGDGTISTADLAAGVRPTDACARQRSDVTGPSGSPDGVYDELDIALIRRVVLRTADVSDLECGGASIYRTEFDDDSYQETHTMLPASGAPQRQLVEYDQWGRLRTVNDPSAPGNAPFAMRLRYDEAFEGVSSGPGAARFDGRLSSIEWVTPITCPEGTTAVSSADACADDDSECFRLRTGTFCASEEEAASTCAGSWVSFPEDCEEGQRCYRALDCTGAECAPRWCAASCATGSDDPSCVEGRRQAYLYDYDAAGRLGTAELREHNGSSWVGSSTDLLPGSMSAQYDAVGNLEQLSRTYQSGPRVQTYTGGRLLSGVSGGDSISFTYDAIGRVRSDSRNYGSTIFTYDAFSQVRMMEQSRQGQSPRIVDQQFDYLPTGARFRTRVYEGNHDGDVELVRDRIDTGSATYENGQLLSWALPFVGIRVPIGSPVGPHGDYVELRDHLGTVRTTVDRNGGVQQVANLDPYGLEIEGQNQDPLTQLGGFTGYQALHRSSSGDHDGSLPAYQHANLRVYDAGIGRFLQPDPVAYDEVGSFTYVDGNPQQVTDVTGGCPGGICVAGLNYNTIMSNVVGTISASDALRAFVQGLLMGLGEGAVGGVVDRILTAAACTNPITCLLYQGGKLGFAAYQIYNAWDEVKGRYSRIFEGEGTWDDWYDFGRDVGRVLAGGRVAAGRGRVGSGRSRNGRSRRRRQDDEATGTRAITPYVDPEGWPPDWGFFGNQSEWVLIGEGTVIDRYGGSDDSRFFSPQGTPPGARSMPLESVTGNLRTFEVRKPIGARAGTIAPWYGEWGGGRQYLTDRTLGWLLKNEYLRELTPK